VVCRRKHCSRLNSAPAGTTDAHQILGGRRGGQRGRKDQASDCIKRPSHSSSSSRADSWIERTAWR
jgi:hypothetical protein